MKPSNTNLNIFLAIQLNSRVWVLDRRAFQQIMMRTGLQRIEENVQFLKSVPLLQNLDDNVLSKIADVLELVRKRPKSLGKTSHKLRND
jgi:hypothetical protein